MYIMNFDNRETLFIIRSARSLVASTGMTWTQALLVSGIECPAHAAKLAKGFHKAAPLRGEYGTRL